ncbi:MAG: hypothetical protein U0U70_11520 [Chitinophagaceae bacterium]
MKGVFSERNIVVILFLMVVLTFSLAQEDSKKKMTMIYSKVATENTARMLTQLTDTKQEATHFLQEPSDK